MARGRAECNAFPRTPHRAMPMPASATRVEAHQGFGDLAQVVKPLEDARHDGAAHELFAPVDGFGLGGNRLPEGWGVGVAGHLDLASPVAYVLDDTMAQVVHGKEPRLPCRRNLARDPNVP